MELWSGFVVFGVDEICNAWRCRFTQISLVVWEGEELKRVYKLIDEDWASSVLFYLFFQFISGELKALGCCIVPTKYLLTCDNKVVYSLQLYWNLEHLYPLSPPITDIIYQITFGDLCCPFSVIHSYLVCNTLYMWCWISVLYSPWYNQSGTPL